MVPKPRAENPLPKDLKLSDRVIDSIRFHYEKLRLHSDTHIVDAASLRLIPEGFRSILAKGTPHDPTGILSILEYTAPRVPKELFTSDTDVTLSFESDPNYFLGEGGKIKEGVQKTKSRSRWYTIEKKEERDKPKMTHITMHAQSQTAVIETIIHLSQIEMMRRKVQKIISKPILTPEETQFVWNTLNHFTSSARSHSQSESHISVWAKRHISVIGNTRLAKWDDLKSSHIAENEHHNITAQHFAKQAEAFLQNNKTYPSILLFSNSYSLPNILSHYLLNKKSGKGTVREYFIRKAQTAWAEKKDKFNTQNKTPFEALGESIACIQKKLSEDEKNFIIDNMIIFDFPKTGQVFDDPIVDSFIREFNSKNRLKNDLGIETAIPTEKSPTADPLHYIDFDKVDSTVIEGLNPLLKDAITQLKQEKVAAFYLPYAPGDLTYSTILEMKHTIPSLNVVAEVGKVAHLVGSVDQRTINEVGQLVVPVSTFATTGDKEKRNMNNLVTSEHLGIFEKVRKVQETHVLQAPLVILQDPDEIGELIKDIYADNMHKQDVSINMETHHINLATLATGMAKAEADYLSDIAIAPELLKKFAALGRDGFIEQITKTMGKKGVFGVHAATAGVLVALANKVRMN